MTSKSGSDGPTVDGGGGGGEGEVAAACLPESIYWDFVRPFTPVKDRVIVSKRCSTRYYAGKRVELDKSYLKTFESRRRVKNAEGDVVEESVVYTNIFVSHGEPGTPQFRIGFDDSSNDDDALAQLHTARSAWDEHLSKISSPSARLHACLDLLRSDDFDGACPFLFDGKGEIGDVVKFHASVNLSSLNGPWQGRKSFPNTQLGYWIACYLNDVMMGVYDGASYSSTWKFRDIVMELIDAGADVNPFFEPLNEYPETFSALSALGHRTRDFFERGMSMHDVLTLQADSYLEEEEGPVWPWQQLSGQPGRTIGNLLDLLGRKSDIVLRFALGDRVECNMGDEEGWMPGTIKRHWLYGRPYEIELDHISGSSVWAPFDGDECIRALNE